MSVFDRFKKFFETTYADHMQKRLEASWFLQDRREKRLRMRFVLLLAEELAKIRQVSVFATAFGEMAIEAIIEGDWKTLAEIQRDLTFDGESKDCHARYNPLWAPFRDIIETALVAHQGGEN